MICHDTMSFFPLTLGLGLVLTCGQCKVPGGHLFVDDFFCVSFPSSSIHKWPFPCVIPLRGDIFFFILHE